MNVVWLCLSDYPTGSYDEGGSRNTSSYVDGVANTAELAKAIASRDCSPATRWWRRGNAWIGLHVPHDRRTGWRHYHTVYAESVVGK